MAERLALSHAAAATLGSLCHSVFTAENGDLIRVVPERGGLLTGWQVQGAKSSIWIRRFLTPGQSVRGGAPILFPICGNLPGDSLPLPGGRTAAEAHGFARDLPWQLSALADGQGVRLELSDSKQTDRNSLEFLPAGLPLGTGARGVDDAAEPQRQLAIQLWSAPLFQCQRPDGLEL